MYCEEKRGARKGGARAGITCAPPVADCFPDYRVHQGIDFLKVSFWVEWTAHDFLKLCQQKKEALQATESEDNLPFTFGGLNWNISRHGARSFRYRLLHGDITLLVSTRGATTNWPSVRLEIGSLTSQTNLVSTLDCIRNFLCRCGAQVVREQVSEVHLAADFIGLNIRELDLDNKDRWISLARHFVPYYQGWKLSGMTLGKGDLMLRIYDKVLELSDQGHKQEVFRELWGVPAYNAQSVTRVEYQLRRGELKRFRELDQQTGELTCFSTSNQLLKGLQSLWGYCTGTWSRFTATMVDRGNKHQARARLSEFWVALQSLCWSTVLEVTREVGVRCKDVDKLRKQVLGCVMSVVAFYLYGDDLYDYRSVLAKAEEFIAEDLKNFSKDGNEFSKRMKRKHIEAVVDVIPF